MFLDLLFSESFASTSNRRPISVRVARRSGGALLGLVLAACGPAAATNLEPTSGSARASMQTYDVVIAETGWLLTVARSGGGPAAQHLASHTGTPAPRTVRRLGDSLLTAVGPGTYSLSLSTAGAPSDGATVDASFISARESQDWSETQAGFDLIIDPFADDCQAPAGFDLIIDPFAADCDPFPSTDLRGWILNHLCDSAGNAFLCAAPIGIGDTIHGSLSDDVSASSHRVLRFQVEDWCSLGFTLDSTGVPLRLRLYSGLGQPLSLDGAGLWPADVYFAVIERRSASTPDAAQGPASFSLRVDARP